MKQANMRFQKGMSFTGILASMLVIGSFLIFASKTIPAYVDDRVIQSILKKLTHGDNDIRGKGKRFVRDAITKSLLVNNIRSTAGDLKPWVITQDDEHFTVDIEYEVRENFFSNIDVVMHFKHRLDTRSPELCCVVR